MRKNLKVAFVILIFSALEFSCSKSGENRNVVGNTQATTPTVTLATPANTPQTESKYIFNLFELVGKAPQEVEMKIGAPRRVRKAEYKTSYDEERQYEVKPIPAPFFLTVRFFHDKAVHFMWAVPPQAGMSEPQELVGKFGFNVENLNVKDFPNAKSWTGTIDEIDFDEITAMKGSSNYSVLKVVVKK